LRSSIASRVAATDSGEYPEQMAQQAQASLQQAVTARRQFQDGIKRRKPPVPADCRTLDSFYVTAIDLEARIASDLLDAVTQHNTRRAEYFSTTAAGRVTLQLDNASQELRKVFRKRSLHPQPVIRVSQ
jgi:hypothetical protein